MSDLFTIRDAADSDLEIISHYAYHEGMGNIESPDGVRVAVDADGAIVGFIRIRVDQQGVAFVNPVVTYPTWRGYGVGRALVEEALKANGQLRLVSRGSSLGFYRQLGFADIDWEAIMPDIAAECDGCELRDECQPQPVGRMA